MNSLAPQQLFEVVQFPIPVKEVSQVFIVEEERCILVKEKAKHSLAFRDAKSL
jgi:hypothetical protein